MIDLITTMKLVKKSSQSDRISLGFDQFKVPNKKKQTKNTKFTPMSWTKETTDGRPCQADRARDETPNSQQITPIHHILLDNGAKNKKNIFDL